MKLRPRGGAKQRDRDPPFTTRLPALLPPGRTSPGGRPTQLVHRQRGGEPPIETRPQQLQVFVCVYVCVYVCVRICTYTI